jgi:hypothetical protein
VPFALKKNILIIANINEQLESCVSEKPVQLLDFSTVMQQHKPCSILEGGGGDGALRPGR